MMIWELQFRPKNVISFIILAQQRSTVLSFFFEILLCNFLHTYFLTPDFYQLSSYFRYLLWEETGRGIMRESSDLGEGMVTGRKHTEGERSVAVPTAARIRRARVMAEAALFVRPLGRSQWLLAS